MRRGIRCEVPSQHGCVVNGDAAEEAVEVKAELASRMSGVQLWYEGQISRFSWCIPVLA